MVPPAVPVSFGRLPRSKVLQNLAECDVLVYPSLHGSGGWVCLEAMAAGPAIAERGIKAALDGRSPILMKYYKATDGLLRANEVGDAAREGDPAAIEIIRDSGQMIGDVLASLVNFYNPDMIVIGGGVSNIGNLLLASIRQAVLNRSLPLSTRNLSIIFSAVGTDAGVTGAVALAIEHVFYVERGSDLN